MKHKIDALLAELDRVSLSELDGRAKALARSEKEASAYVIATLAKVAERRADKHFGAPSLFEYARSRLGFSEGETWMRVQVAYKAVRFPQLLEAIAENRISLSVASLLAPHLTVENADRLISDSTGKTTRETKAYVTEFKPKPAFDPSVRKQPERSPRKGTEAGGASPTTADEGSPGGLGVAPAEEAPASTPPRTPSLLEAATPAVYNFRFSASKKLRDKLYRLAEVLGVGNPVGRLAEVLERAIDTTLERKDPKRRRERRLEREERARRKREKAEKPRAHEGTAEEPTPAPRSRRPEDGARDAAKSSCEEALPSAAVNAQSRRDPAGGCSKARRRPPTREWEESLEGVGHRCEYRGPDGTRCTARTGLQPDHYPVPYAAGGSSGPENIRVHCRAHNSHTAREYFGAEFIDEKIAQSRARREAKKEAKQRATCRPFRPGSTAGSDAERPSGVDGYARPIRPSVT